jgi:hypothetical protein
LRENALPKQTDFSFDPSLQEIAFPGPMAWGKAVSPDWETHHV